MKERNKGNCEYESSWCTFLNRSCSRCEYNSDFFNKYENELKGLVKSE